MKKHEKPEAQKYEERLKAIAVAISLILTLGNVVSSIFNFAMASKLTPVTKNVETLSGRVFAVESEQKSLATKEELTLMIDGVKDDIGDLKTSMQKMIDLHTK